MSEEGIKTAAKKLQGSLLLQAEYGKMLDIEGAATGLVKEIKSTTSNTVEQRTVATQLRDRVYSDLEKAQAEEKNPTHMPKSIAVVKRQQADFCCKTVVAAIRKLNDMRENPSA